MKSAALVFLTVLSCRAWAADYSLGEETDWSASQFIEQFNAESDFGAEENKNPSWNVNGGYTYSRIVSPNPGGDDIVDNSTSLSGGFGWTGVQGIGTNVTLEYSKTPEENLVSRGGRADFSYRWRYGSEAEEEFHPYLTFKLDCSTTNYLENYYGTVPRKKLSPRPVTGTAEIRQNSLEPGLKWRPLRDWKISASIAASMYNRDVATFQNSLDSPRALHTGVAGFSNTVGGLPRVTYNFAVSWMFAEDWEAKVSEAWSELAADNTNSTITKFTLGWNFAEAWKLTAGAEYQFSEITTDTLGILGLDFDF